MKSTIIFLGLALLTVTNTRANQLLEQEVLQQDAVAVNSVTIQKADLIFNRVQSLKSATIDNTGDTAVFNPESVLKTTSVKTVEETLKENKLITEADQEIYQPLCLEMSVQDKIQEDNQIIESTISEEVFPLDFEKINRTAQCIIKVDLNNTAIPVDIKL